MGSPRGGGDAFPPSPAPSCGIPLRLIAFQKSDVLCTSRAAPPARDTSTRSECLYASGRAPVPHPFLSMQWGGSFDTSKRPASVTQSYTPSFFSPYTSRRAPVPHAFFEPGFEETTQITVVGRLVESEVATVAQVLLELEGQSVAQHVERRLIITGIMQ